jgi:Carboxypeptidase regulatory-like domain
MSKLKLSLLLCLVTGILFVGQTFAAAFTPGNIAVCRIGDGAAALSNVATAVFVDEFTPAGTFVQSIAMPTTVSGANQILTNSGSGTTDCAITRSSDGNYLVLTGYNAALGTPSVATTASATFPRVIGRIGVNGVFDTSTTTTSFTGAAIRSAVSNNGIDFWFAGGNNGVFYNQIGGSGAGTLVSSTITNNRVLNIFNNQLYAAHASGTTLARIGTIGAGLPTTADLFTGLPGYIVGAGSNYGFYLADLDTAVAGLDTMYVADDSAAAVPSTLSSGGVKKFSLVAGNWTYNGTFPAVTGPPAIPTATFRGLTGRTTGTTVTLYATRNGNQLTKMIDATGYNVAPTANPTELAVAATNTAYRGVATAPCSVGALAYSATVYNVVRTGTATITVQRPNMCDTPVSINYETVAFGTANPATPGVDYTAANGTLNFASGEMTKTFTVPTFLSGEGKDIGLALSLQMSNFSSFNKGLQVQAVINILAPTAADASIRGRLLTPTGRGLSNAFVTLTDTNSGEVRRVRSTSLGYFNFRDLESGDFYILSVQSKRYTFENRSFTLNDNIDDLVLTGQ